MHATQRDPPHSGNPKRPRARMVTELGLQAELKQIARTNARRTIHGLQSSR